MKMLMSCLVAFACAVSYADTKADAKAKTLAVREKVLTRTGGFILSPAKGRPIKFVKLTKDIPAGALESVIKGVETGPHLSVAVAEGEPGKRYLADDASGAIIEIRNDKADPMTILVAPEQAWASVNLAPLMTDTPSADKLSLRVRKEIWRAIVYMLGGGNSDMPACVMQPVARLNDIDNLKMAQPCPEPFRKVTASAVKLNIGHSRSTTYRKACEEGWAPEPKNDYQRAVWDEFHSKPTEPMKIKFDKKLGK